LDVSKKMILAKYFLVPLIIWIKVAAVNQNFCRKTNMWHNMAFRKNDQMAHLIVLRTSCNVRLITFQHQSFRNECELGKWSNLCPGMGKQNPCSGHQPQPEQSKWC